MVHRVGPAATAALGAIGALRALRTRNERRFFDPRDERAGPYEGHAGPYFLPIHYHASPTFVGIFPAATAAVDAVLPADQLHPVKLPDGRSALLIAALIHRDVTYHTPQEPYIAQMIPYGELGIFALCTHGTSAPGRSRCCARPCRRAGRWEASSASAGHQPRGHARRT
jgi:hypothetical protein